MNEKYGKHMKRASVLANIGAETKANMHRLHAKRYYNLSKYKEGFGTNKDSEIDADLREIISKSRFAAPTNHDSDRNAVNEMAHFDLHHNVDSESRDALELFEKVLKFDIKYYGLHSPIAAMTSNYIGEAYYKLAEYEKALDMFRNVLVIDEQVHGTYSLGGQQERAKAKHMIALVYYQQEKYLEALEMNEEALALLGPQHPLVVTIKLNMGDVYKMQSPIYLNKLELSCSMSLRKT